MVTHPKGPRSARLRAGKKQLADGDLILTRSDKARADRLGDIGVEAQNPQS